MLERSLDGAAHEVLRRFRLHASTKNLVALGNHGGFSGARLWRVETEAVSLCLRAWPPNDPSTQRLRWIHSLMDLAQRRGVEFVPALLRADDGRTWVEYGSRLWELSTWMPGRADFHKAPSASRLESSCRALGRLHRAWAAEETKAGPCPGIQRRIERSCEWKELVASGWIPVFGAPGLDSVRGYAERAWLLVRVFAERVPSVLAEWASRPFRLQPCLCDIWHDHVLFDGENVRGLIDYGGVKIDNVTVDLARLLGSMVGDHRAARDAGLRAYSLIRTLADEEQAIVDLLDKTGTIVGLENWLRWLYFDKKPLIDLGAVSERLRNLVERVEEWETAGSGAL